MKKSLWKKSVSASIALLVIAGAVPIGYISDSYEMSAFTARAEDDEVIPSGECGENVTWEINGRILNITGTGAMYDYSDPELVPWKEYIDSVALLSVDDEVTYIGANSFALVNPIKYILGGDGIKEIGNGAFSGCKDLDHISFTSDSQLETIGDNAFNGCENINSFIISCGLKSIGKNAFKDCTGLTSLQLPSCLESIDDSAFENCINIEDIYFTAAPENLTWKADAGSLMPDKATRFHVPVPFLEAYQSKFADCNMTIVGDIEVKGSCGDNAEWEVVDTDSNGTFDRFLISGTGQMSDYARIDDEDSSTPPVDTPWYIFVGDITSAEFDGDITNIGDYTFYNFEALTDIIWDENGKMETIGFGAFIGCDSFTTFTVPKSVKTLGGSVFALNLSLKTFDFEEGSQLETIGKSAFFLSTELESVNIPSSVISIGNEAFSMCDSLSSVSFEEGSKLETIGNGAFSASSIEAITIPGSVITIGDEAFYMCESLSSVSFEEGSKLETIGKSAFRATGIENITIPSGVISIGQTVFYETPLKAVEFEEGTSLESIGEWAFGYSAIEKITIPSSVTSIGDTAFYKCESLSSISFEK